MTSLTKDYIQVKGGQVLKGTVQASGSKNAILPILFATILADGDYEIQRAPLLQDVIIAQQILESLGFKTARHKDVLKVTSSIIKNTEVSQELAQQMRASFLCLGPLLAKYHKARVPLPGGCQIGKRPVDIHLKALEQLGVNIKIQNGFVEAIAPQGLIGAQIKFDFPTVGGTENVIMASVLAKGQTILQNQAREPEIFNLIEALKNMGAQIEETEKGDLKITGVHQLHPFKSQQVISDRIEAGTLLLAGAITGGDVCVEACNPKHLSSFLDALEECGFLLEIQNQSIRLQSTEKLKTISIQTEVYPGFPTDLQSQFASLMTQLPGESSLKESIFEDRFRYVESLKKFQAKIEIVKKENRLKIAGPCFLQGAQVQATDLRASAGLILAALVANGSSFVTDIFHLDRGYENLDKKLQSLGASIKRMS